ncbi:hypothetical protein Gorai_024650 [Gossypium raimondii]|uniref:Uncharacterized protein n=1 Tax=Gossypium raimondii TaxID=29730 RepID=A0A7J8P050_GOSRA|nr:hypothetical protein [Gossypium raimondii]
MEEDLAMLSLTSGEEVCGAIPGYAYNVSKSIASASRDTIII